MSKISNHTEKERRPGLPLARAVIGTMLLCTRRWRAQITHRRVIEPDSRLGLSSAATTS